jgi:hypothetical protein
MKEWEELFTVEEPHVTAYAKLIREQLQSRKTPIPTIHSTAHHLRVHTHTQIKRILLQFHPRAVELLSKCAIEEILTTKPTPFPETEKSFTGVYIGGYLHADCSGLSIRDVVRLANVLLDKEKIMDILDGISPGYSTFKAARKLGESWRDSCRQLGLWADVNEVEGNAEFTEDEDEDEEDEEVEDPEEEDEEPQSSQVDLESDDESAAGPRELQSKSFSRPFPFSPCYVGYGKTPDSRIKDHLAGFLHPDKANRSYPEDQRIKSSLKSHHSIHFPRGLP